MKTLVGSVVVLWLILVVVALCIGPIAFAYDLNHLVPLLTHKPLNVSPWNPGIFIVGLLLSEAAVPVALVVWVLVTVGVLM